MQLDGVERVAVLRGRARRDRDRAVAGDRVLIDPETINDEMLAIESVQERQSLLSRRTPEGRGERPVAANVDQVLVVTAAADPDPVLQLIDRLLLVAEANSLPASVVINKIDLASSDEVAQHLASTGYPVLTASAETGAGIEKLRGVLIGKETVLAGPSGAGKSSLLNAIEPGLGLRVGAISRKVRRGKHTTTTASMVSIGQGGFVVDTPGFSEVGVWGVAKEDLEGLFPEFASYSVECRFGDCQHRLEPGCRVLDALKAGDIPASRHSSYLTMWDELAAQPEDWE